MTTFPNDNQLLQNLPPRPLIADTRWRANINPAPNCPRCASSNTKFCYYNNYSLAQPRFFCKGCRRYWTKGGSLRNVPVGGGCRKSRRSRASKTGFSNSRSENNNNNNSSPNSSSSNCSEINCPDIDMAAVFAKFLNPGQEIINEGMNEATPNTTSSETSYDSPVSGPNCGPITGYDYQNKLSDDLFDHQKQLQLQEVDQEGCYITPDLTSFGDILDDVFWLEDSNNSSSLSWQNGGQVQEFNSTMPYSEENNSTTNLFSGDNWSYFDISGFEVLSDHDSL